jgi:NTP pyrophosphatase (non-canonical NTP hydrolase)
MELDEYQREAHATAKSRDIEVFTLGLFGEAGSVASAIKKLKRDNDAEEVVRAEIATELGDVLWYLAEIATSYGLSLSEVASANLEKTKYLFSGDDLTFETGAPPEERFPREAPFEFIDQGEKVLIRWEGREFGDPLDDNAHHPDGYKFHDVFHLAYMTRLGWSPVTRALLGLKRRYDKDIDRVEDGARAVFLEEGLSVFVFNQNRTTVEGISSFADRRNIPFTILSAIKTITQGLEVSRRDVTAWRDAIAMGFQMFDKLVGHDGGTVTCNLDTKKMHFKAPDGTG